MEIISLNNHIVRKALTLSLNEMAVLCDIKYLSNSREYGNWCVKSKSKMADWLDLSERSIFNAIEALIEKGYVEKNEKGFLRLTAWLNHLDASQEIALMVKSKDIALATSNIKEFISNAEHMQNLHTPLQNLHTSNTTSNTNIKEASLEKVTAIIMNRAVTLRTKAESLKPLEIEELIPMWWNDRGELTDFKDDNHIRNSFSLYITHLIEEKQKKQLGKKTRNEPVDPSAPWRKDYPVNWNNPDAYKDDTTGRYNS